MRDWRLGAGMLSEVLVTVRAHFCEIDGQRIFARSAAGCWEGGAVWGVLLDAGNGIGGFAILTAGPGRHAVWVQVQSIAIWGLCRCIASSQQSGYTSLVVWIGGWEVPGFCGGCVETTPKHQTTNPSYQFEATGGFHGHVTGGVSPPFLA